MPFSIGPFELIVLGVVAVLLFGSRLPEVARNLGSSYQQFRKGLNEIQNSLRQDLDSELNEVKRIGNDTYRDFRDDFEVPAPQFSVPPSDDEEIKS